MLFLFWQQPRSIKYYRRSCHVVRFTIFNRIKVPDTIEHLKRIAAKEGVQAEEEALNVIAQKADGAMRDVLSIFDQVVSFCGEGFDL